MATIGIPPNGFTGAAQQTAAVRNHIATHSSKSLGHTKSRKRRRKTSAKSIPRKRKSGSGKGITILKAGSAAAKAWGAKMKRLRKKKAA
jgi:hypothetical protein